MSSKQLHPNLCEYQPSYEEISGNILYNGKAHRVGSHGHHMAPNGHTQTRRWHRHKHLAENEVKDEAETFELCENCGMAEHPAEFRECASCNDEHNGCCNAKAFTFFYKGDQYKINELEHVDEEKTKLAVVAVKN